MSFLSGLGLFQNFISSLQHPTYNGAKLWAYYGLCSSWRCVLVLPIPERGTTTMMMPLPTTPSAFGSTPSTPLTLNPQPQPMTPTILTTSDGKMLFPIAPLNQASRPAPPPSPSPSTPTTPQPLNALGKSSKPPSKFNQGKQQSIQVPNQVWLHLFC